jgi:hypothetical protein
VETAFIPALAGLKVGATLMMRHRRKAHHLARHATDKKSLVAGKARKNFSKLIEQSGNVDENKGPLRRISERSGNVLENTST